MTIATAMIAAMIGTGLVLGSLSASAQQMYRWVDKSGKVHYSDSAPVDQGKGVENRKLGASVIDTSGLDYGTQQAVKNHPVTLYTAPNCKDACDQARAMLSKRGVPFSEISVTDEQTRAALSKASGDTQVPVLLVGRDMTKGWEPGAYTGALDSAGYPKSIAPGRQQQAAAKPPADAAKAGATNPNELQRPKGKYLP
ncbi:MAG: glutaredoxin family protein [Burkholderiales bacterium]